MLEVVRNQFSIDIILKVVGNQCYRETPNIFLYIYQIESNLVLLYWIQLININPPKYAFLLMLFLGVAVGAGLQGTVAIVNIACYYVIGIPLGVFLGYVVHLQVKVKIITPICFFHFLFLLKRSYN